MHITHLALWSKDIEALRTFYVTHFACKSNARYDNPGKGFSSYFLEFDGGVRLEIMQRADLKPLPSDPLLGLAHFAVSTGSEENVRRLTQKLEAAGVSIIGQPRRTGDGYFESVVADPEGNQIELTI